MIKRYQVFCVFFLLVISSIGPLSFGYKLSQNRTSIENDSTFQSLDGTMNSSWPMQSHNLHHTGRRPYSTADNPGIEKWKFSFGPNMNSIFGGPVIDNNGDKHRK